MSLPKALCASRGLIGMKSHEHNGSAVRLIGKGIAKKNLPLNQV
jgi:hypothetical protein